MNANDFNLNRPIHLARRDVHFERAVELLYMPFHELDTTARIRHVESVLKLLQTAQHHAFLAAKTTSANQPEEDFLRFLNLISHNVQSAHSMMQHQTHLENEEGFLTQFLSAAKEDCALPALHYRRRADDILQGVWHLLRLAHRPYRALQTANTGSLSAEELARYRRAYESFHTEVNERFALDDQPTTPVAART